MARLTNPEPLSHEVQRRFEELRARDRLRALSGEESGTGVNRLPGGVYGFTYSPAEDNFPLFTERDVRSYESHKLEDGTILLLGFLTPEERKALEERRSSATVHLLPEPKGAAQELVEIPLERIVSHVENSQRLGTGLELTLGPGR